MDFDNLNKWLSLVANLGVLIGIFLLIAELNQTNKLAETQSYVGRLNQMQESNMIFATSESLAGIREKARSEGIAALTPTERSRLSFWEDGVLNRMASQYYQYEQGYLDEFTAGNVFNSAVTFVKYWEELGLRFDNNRFRIAIKNEFEQRK